MDGIWSRRGDRVLSFAFWVGLLALLAGAVLLAVVLVTQGADRANAWASVLSTALAITGALVMLVTWRLKQRAAAAEPAGVDQVTRAAQELQAAVREQWRKELEVRLLGDPPMPVRWRLSDPKVMDHDEHIGPAPLRFIGRSDRIPALTEQFLKLRRHRLVIIGGPGSGKTTLAVQLLLQLLEGWQPGEPVPVLFSLTSWDPHMQSRVQDWLAGQLSQTYPNLRAFGANAAQRLADQGWLLPVLDGLDEIPTERRGEIIKALNKSLHPDNSLIVTSRTVEYRDTVGAFDVLTAAAVIELEPLTAREAAAHLKDVLPRQPDESWQAVLTALRGDTAGALAEVVASPLGLWLLRVVHIEGRHDPQSLIDPNHYPNAAAIQNHLLEELIPAVVRSRLPLPSGSDPLRPQRHHDPAQVRRWLTTLAIELRDAQTRDWRWWQLARHTVTTPRLLGGLVGLVGGLVLGLGGALVLGLGGLVFGLVGLLFGLFGLLFGLGAGLNAFYSDVPVHADLRIRGRTRVLALKLVRGLLVGLAGGLVGGLVLGVVLAPVLLLVAMSQGGQLRIGVGGGLHVLELINRLGIPIGYPVGLAVGLAVGLMAGLMGGLISFAASPSIAQRANSPADSQRGDRDLTVLFASTFGVLLIVLVGQGRGGGLWLLGLASQGAFLGGLGVLGGLLNMLLVGLGGLLGGLLVGPVVAHTCWLAFVMASLWLRAQRRLPFRLMAFLDDAYRLGLLRIVGAVYQFRHAALQDHLAPPVLSSRIGSGVSPMRDVFVDPNHPLVRNLYHLDYNAAADARKVAAFRAFEEATGRTVPSNPSSEVLREIGHWLRREEWSTPLNENGYSASLLIRNVPVAYKLIHEELAAKAQWLQQHNCIVCNFADVTPYSASFAVRTRSFSSQSLKPSYLTRLKQAINEDLRTRANYIEKWEGCQFCVTIVAVASGHGRKDVDNMVKGLLDAMQGVVYTDDQRVQHLSIHRLRHAAPESYYLIHVKPVQDARADIVDPVLRHSWLQAEIAVPEIGE